MDNAAYPHDGRADNAAYRHDRRADSQCPDLAVDKKHNRAGPGQIYGKYRRFRAGSTEFIGK